ncbi:MAG: helix-turn-helix domain-containing protein [Verrucomicrobia bacterium]|nr:helix-turn-helix domain-containing protein [Verrucomicrobiota bacterium]
MPNFVAPLRQEIARIARKEAKSLVAPVKKPSGKLRSFVADLKRRVASLEKTNGQLMSRLAKLEVSQPGSTESPDKRGWISGKGIRSLRKRLGLSQADFARLVGVSSISVYQWESKKGMLTFRGGTKAKVFAVRGIGAREAKARLAEMPKEPMGKKAPKANKVTKRAGKRRK